MKEFMGRMKNKIADAWRYSIHTWIFKCFAEAFLLELVLEMLGRRSVLGGFSFLLYSPFVFFYNVSIIFFTLLFALFLRKRIFGMMAIGLVWLICGIVNYVVLGYRVTPFAAIDFVMAKDVLSMLDVYMAKWQQILLLIFAIALIAGIVFLFRKSPKFEGSRRVKGTMAACVVVWIAVIALTKFSVKHNIISDDFANLGMAYKDYGFAYCFTNSIIDNGIDKPDDYSEETMQSLKSELDSIMPVDAVKKPNIIYIQLESFFDPKTVKGLELSSDPVPNFTALKEEYPSGYLTVPAIGAGTAHTEFEVMTSLESSSFGAGEYPYKTTVNKVPVVGVASQLKSLGYGTFAIHNNTATFYDRIDVYEQMGYDAFVSLEYMYDIEETSTGWAKDATLPDDIMRCLESTEGQDLVYTISVQGHGKYPDGEDTCTDHIQVSYDDPEMQDKFHYYVNQIYEMDEMIGDLIDRLDAYGEDYVLVLYGDHLPTLNLEDEMLSSGNLFQTEYIIVNNINLKMKDEDLYASQLSANLFNRLNMPLSYAQKVNISCSGEERDEKLNIIAYDMLFGERYLYSGDRVVPENEMQMGILPISVTTVKNAGDHIVVTGENFNSFSVVYIDGTAENTTYIDDTTLMVDDKVLSGGEEITVAQVDDSHHVLGETAIFDFK
jgi:phosphoglycerol transferase MdoB-like AlkP superfamily enzyme